jgi:hypothetical protein
MNLTSKWNVAEQPADDGSKAVGLAKVACLGGATRDPRTGLPPFKFEMRYCSTRVNIG